MNPVQKTIRFAIEESGQMQTDITEELALEWIEDHWECHNYFNIDDATFRGEGQSQTAAILDWLAYRIGAK